MAPALIEVEGRRGTRDTNPLISVTEGNAVILVCEGARGPFGVKIRGRKDGFAAGRRSDDSIRVYKVGSEAYRLGPFHVMPTK